MHRRSSLQFLLAILLLAPLGLLAGCGVNIPKRPPQVNIVVVGALPAGNVGSVTVAVSLTALAPGPVPTGTLSYQVSAPFGVTFTGPLQVPASTFDLQIAGSGNYVIQVTYSGDAHYAGTTATSTLLVPQAASSTGIKLYKGYPPVQ
jgi:hypothetical protein